MANLTVAAVVTRFESAAAGLSGWVASPLPVGLVARSGRPVQHKAASVMAVQTDVPPAAQPTGRRATIAEGAYVVTRLRIEWAWALTPDDYSAALLDAYAGEQALIAALMAVSRVDLTHFPERMARALVDGDRAHLTGSIDWICHHTIALA